MCLCRLGADLQSLSSPDSPLDSAEESSLHHSVTSLDHASLALSHNGTTDGGCICNVYNEKEEIDLLLRLLLFACHLNDLRDFIGKCSSILVIVLLFASQ